jgi:hypothetical protein
MGFSQASLWLFKGNGYKAQSIPIIAGQNRTSFYGLENPENVISFAGFHQF